MSDEAKPPKDEAAGAPKRPRKPAAKKPAAKKLAARKPAVKKSAAAAAASTAETPSASAPAAAASDEAATQVTAPGADGADTQVAPPDAAEADTQVAPPDAAATQVIPEAPTEVIPAGDTPSATGGSAPPAPPFAPVPRTVDKTGDGDKSTTVWLVVALAALAVVAVILVWAFALRDTGEQFVGNWAPADGGGGGLVVSLADGDFTVAMYDEDLELLGSYPAARDGDVLTYRFTDIQSGRGQMKATLTYDEGTDMLTLRLTSASSQGASAEYVRVDALEAAAAPTPSASPTATPTASPTASPTGSPSPSPSPSETNSALLDQEVVDGIVAIQVGILDWSNANGGVYPSADEVTSTGAVAQYVATWPTNPFTGQSMGSGTAKGDYVYEQLNGGQGYKLTGYLSSGTFTVP